MENQLLNYTFNPAARQVIFSGDIPLEEQIGYIVNVATNNLIYQFADPRLKGELVGNTLTLDYDTTAMSATDKLKITYDNISTTPTIGPETGLSKEATQLLVKAKTDNIDVPLSTRLNTLGQKPMSSSTPVTMATDQTPIPVNIASGDITVSNLTATFDSKVSTVNSSNTPLAANAVFLGEWEDVTNYAGITVSIFTDQYSAIGGGRAQWSIDGTDAGILDDGSSQAVTIPPGLPVNFEFSKKARFFRIRYTNGATAQTVLKSQVIYNLTAQTPGKRILASQLTDYDSATASAAHLFARQVTGQWLGVGVNSSRELFVDNGTDGATSPPIGTKARGWLASIYDKVGSSANQTIANTTLNDILVELRDDTFTTSFLWEDVAPTPHIFYREDRIKSQDTGAITTVYTRLSDNTVVGSLPATATPVAANNDRMVEFYRYVAVAAGTGYSIGDWVTNTVVFDSSGTGAIIANSWYNLTTATSISTPSFANLRDPEYDNNLEATQLLIKAKTDNLDVLLSTRASETTLSILNTKMPAQGQALAAASVPVVLTAAQQAALTPPPAITGFSTASNQTNKTQFTRITDGTNDALVSTGGGQIVAGLSAVGTIPTNNPVSVSGIDAGGLKRPFLLYTDGTMAVLDNNSAAIKTATELASNKFRRVSKAEPNIGEEIRFDDSVTDLYIGIATAAAATSSATWDVVKYSRTAGAITRLQFKQAIAWDNRTSGANW